MHREDMVVRAVDLSVPPESVPALALGVAGPGAAAELSELVVLGDHDLCDEAAIDRFRAECEMSLVTDRRAKGA